MKVVLIPETEQVNGNILWTGRWPMKAGTFPDDHPVKRGTITDFRNRGYWASSFPEGDGITFKCEENQSMEIVTHDIQECFGWDM